MPTTAETDARLLPTPRAQEPGSTTEGYGRGLKELIEGKKQKPKLWATPNTMDHLPQRSEESLKKMAEGHRKGRALPSNLREQVDPETVRKWQEAQEPKLWATPRTSDVTSGRTLNEKGQRISKTNPNLVFGANLSDQIKMYPTPAARDYKGMLGKGRQERKGNPKDTLPNAVGGSLNPEWVEWLMGYPVGYTALDN